MISNTKQKRKETQRQGRKKPVCSGSAVELTWKSQEIPRNGNTVESTSKSQDIPQPMDIILGRGKANSKNPGNVIFQEFILSNRQRYYESSFPIKRAIIDDVMQLIQNIGGRFICMKNNVWSIIPPKACRIKIAHAIQYHIRNEFTRGMNITVPSSITDDIIHAKSGPEVLLSDHERYILDIQAKISLLHMQSNPSNITTSHNSIGNNLQSYNSDHCRSELLLNEGDVGIHQEKEVQSGNPHAQGSTFVDQHKAALSFTSNYDAIKNDQQAIIYSGSAHCKRFPPELPSSRHIWMDEDLLPTTTASRTHADMNRLPESTRIITPERDRVWIHKESASFLVVPDVIETSERNSSTIHSCSANQLVEPRTHEYYFENIQAMENMYNLQSLNHGHDYHDIAHYATGLDARPSPRHSRGGGINNASFDRTLVVEWNAELESSFDLMEDRYVPILPILGGDEGDFECASFPLSIDSDIDDDFCDEMPRT